MTEACLRPSKRLPSFISCSPRTPRRVIRPQYPHLRGHRRTPYSSLLWKGSKTVNIQSRRRIASLTGVALVGTFALAGCGSNSNTTASSGSASSTGGSASTADCGTGTLGGEGSTARRNAIDQAITGLPDDMPRRDHQLQRNGLGRRRQAVSPAGQVAFGGSGLRPEERPGLRARLAPNRPPQTRRVAPRPGTYPW